MQCGRRMFLASLILASKYLQDRNFSARAWSKISGLKACEINANEMAFLSAVNWKLHIPEPVFNRWTDLVLKYSPSASLASPRSSARSVNSWKAIIPRLTPALDTVDFGHAELAPNSKRTISEIHRSLAKQLEEPIWSRSNEPTPTNKSRTPSTLEPTPRATCTGSKVLPPLPHLGPLPTPKLTTPQQSSFTPTFSTPAVGAEGLGPRRSSMSIAMEQARNASTARMTLDYPNPSWRPVLAQPFSTSTGTSSLAKSSSTLSSPESMISDTSSRSSRSSSISSAASTCALPLPRPGKLAAQATRRCANMQLSGIKVSLAPAYSQLVELQNATLNALHRLPHKGISTSPGMPTENHGNHTSKAMRPSSMDFTAADEEAVTVLQTLALDNQPTSRPAKCHKRSRPLSMDLGVQASVQDPTIPRHLSVSELHNGGQRTGYQTLALDNPPTSRPAKCHKRSRPLSMDLGVQGPVQDLTGPRHLSASELHDGISRNGDDSTVPPDGKVADSFLVPKAGDCQVNGQLMENPVKFLLAKEGPRKRTCSYAIRHETSQLGLLMAQHARYPRPGMWKGIL
ncbi:MAG: hypothetical protein Q9221_001415 [Calogaya cf. arnoldii]